jgi:hypothetical protein
MLALLAWLSVALAEPPRAPAQGSGEAGQVVIAVLPQGTTVEEIASVDGMAPGILSAGLGEVPGAQTYLDISQGNRVSEKLYGTELPPLIPAAGGVAPEEWARAVDRAEDAPADVVPGLLATTLARAGVDARAEPDAGRARLIAADEDGRIAAAAPDACAQGECELGLTVVGAELDELEDLAEGLGPEGLLIAFAGAPPAERLLAMGMSGAGYTGDLTSDSTRTDGVVITPDITATVLDRLGVEVPDEVNGSEIRSGEERDPEGVAELMERLDDRASRDLVVLLPLAVWALAVALAAAIWRRRGAAVGLVLLALACAWAPLTLLVAAALDADEATSAFILGLGSVALALATRRFVPGTRGLALAAGATVAAHAVDVVAGSPLTSLSVLGPNPGGGVRFFGIGNELEAILTTLTLIGTGAFLATVPGLSRRSAAAWFLAVALIAAAAFAPGRFGADVGAAIVLGVGGATAAALALGLSVRRTVAAVVVAGVLGVLALVAVDALLGGAHFARSVLGAGEASDVIDVFDRRVSLMLDTFTHPVYPELLVATAVALALGLWRRGVVLGWFGERWPARCGYLGALVGVLVGTVANDSGSVLLVIGTIYLAVSAGYFWATRAGDGPHADGGYPYM